MGLMEKLQWDWMQARKLKDSSAVILGLIRSDVMLYCKTCGVQPSDEIYTTSVQKSIKDIMNALDAIKAKGITPTPDELQPYYDMLMVYHEYDKYLPQVRSTTEDEISEVISNVMCGEDRALNMKELMAWLKAYAESQALEIDMKVAGKLGQEYFKKPKKEPKVVQEVVNEHQGYPENEPQE